MSTSSRRPPYHSQSSSQSRLDPPLSSPAPSTSQFSGISGYAAESRAGGSGGGGGNGPGGGAAGGGSGESRRVAREHWDALRGFLVEFLKKEPANSRANAREKLTRLTRQQFQELSTDVYDELMRRIADGTDGQGETPFLPLRPDFHPKRNQARQKLATLPKSRFKDLASDVYYELNRRYPEFSEPEEMLEQPRSPTSDYSNAPITPNRPGSANRQYNEPYPPAVPPADPSHRRDRSRDSERERDRGYASPTNSQGGPNSSSRPPYMTSNRQASITRTLSSSSNPGGIPPPTNANSLSATNGGPAPYQANTATTSTVVANKSMIAEEDIQVPYARDSNQDLARTAGSETLGSPAMASDNGGMNGSGSEYYDRLSFGSATSRAARSQSGAGGGGNGMSAAWDREKEELKREYEYRIANLTGKLGQLEGGAEGAREGEAREREGRERAERDMDAVKEQLATFTETLRTLGRELDETRAVATREKERVRTLEIQLREQAEDHERALGEERERAANDQDAQSSSETLTDLKSQVQDLVRELNSLSLMHEELHRERENDQQRIRQAEDKAKEMEQKWRTTKTELRNLKATSQMFVSAPRTEDHLPASSNGALADVHVTAFQTSIDGLITAARSTTPTSVLGAMKPVITAMANLSADIQTFEDRPLSSKGHVDSAALQSLKDRSTQNLNTLTHSAKEFALSYGLSPISLLDAAASELAANVVGLFKLLGIRRANKKDLERSESQATLGGSMQNGTNGTTLANGSAGSYSNGPSYPSAASTSYGTMGPPASTTRRAPPPSSSSSRRPDSAASDATDRYDPRSSTGTARPDPPPSSPNLSSRMDPRRMTSTSSIGSAFDLERKPSVTGSAAGEEHSRRGGGERNPPSWESGRISAGGMRGLVVEEREEAERDGGREEELEEDEEEDERDGDRAWGELKPYLDTQSESLIQAIQTLLSAVRTGDPTPVVRENLSIVIALASSIVGVSKDSLPLRALGEGRRLLRELGGNCEVLSELGEEAGGGEMGKEQRNRVAKTTFELAKGSRDDVLFGRMSGGEDRVLISSVPPLVSSCAPQNLKNLMNL